MFCPFDFYYFINFFFVAGVLYDGSGLDDRCCGQGQLNDNQLCLKEKGFTQIIEKEREDHDAWCYVGNQYVFDQSKVHTFNSAEKVSISYLLCTVKNVIIKITKTWQGQVVVSAYNVKRGGNTQLWLR